MSDANVYFDLSKRASGAVYNGVLIAAYYSPSTMIAVK